MKRQFTVLLLVLCGVCAFGQASPPKPVPIPLPKPMTVALAPAEATLASALYFRQADIAYELATVHSLMASTSDPLYELYEIAWNEATAERMRNQQDINAFKTSLSKEYVLTSLAGVLKHGWTKNCFTFSPDYTHIAECP